MITFLSLRKSTNRHNISHDSVSILERRYKNEKTSQCSYFLRRVKNSLAMDVLAKAKKKGFGWADRVIGQMGSWACPLVPTAHRLGLTKPIHIVAVTF